MRLAGRSGAVPDPPAGGVPDPPAPPDPRRSPVRPGDRLAGRYRLVEPLPATPGGGAVLWRAVDEVLARPVAVTLLPVRSRTGDREVAGPLLKAAARTGPVLAPGLVRTFDATVEERPGPDGTPRVVAAYVISEWVDGRPLSDVLRDGPLPPAEAARLTGEAAVALTALHRAGLAHGRLTPRVLLLTPAGRLRVSGAALSAVLHGEPAAPDGVLADTRALAAVLHALLTAHWPGPPEHAAGLPLAPSRDGRAVPPRQLRPAVPRALDRVVAAALDPADTDGARTPEQLAERSAAALGRRGGSVPVAPARARRRRRVRRGLVVRLLAWTVSLALVVVVGVGGYRLGLRVGTLDPDDEPLALPSVGAAPRPGVVDLSAAGVRVRDLDPSGDRREQPAEVGRVSDGDRRTAWRTDRYRTADLGGLKPGVGLLVDLGRSRRLARVEVDAAAAGATYELRAGDDARAAPRGMATVARVERAGRSARLQPRATARGRYWLLWVTRLPADRDGFRLAVEELRLVPR